MTQYKIELKLDGNWGETSWEWSVFQKGKLVWTGVTGAKFTARRAAKKAAKKHSKGMRQPDPKDRTHEKFWYTV